MTLDARIGLQRGDLTVDLQLRVAAGEVLALIGPNGAGKTSALLALAGLLPLDRGRIAIGETVLDSPTTGQFLPPERRSVGFVFQDYLLFGHMSVVENVAFGLRARGVSRSAARRVAEDWLGRVGLSGVAARRPAALSGGQAQRVALARALAIDPDLLLLDEPLAALDAATRGEVRRDLRAHLSAYRGICVLVTHDPVDAFALADQVMVVESGETVQEGSLVDVAAHPRSRYVAELVGINLVEGWRRGDRFHSEPGAEVVVGGLAMDGPAFAAIRPQAISLHHERPEGSQRNAWRLTVEAIDLQADRVRVRLGGALPLVAEITPGALSAMGLRHGASIWAAVKASEVVTYPR